MSANQNNLKKIKRDYLEAKKQLEIYKWGGEKSKRGMAILYKDIKLAEQKLKNQLEQEKEINRIKSEFVSLASHQLRAPLTITKWYAEMLLSEEVGKLNLKQKEYLQRLYQGNEQMINLVGDLLNVSRIEMGVLAVNPELVDIEELLKGVILGQEFFIEEKKHQVVVEVAEALPKIFTDPTLAKMIFQNLLGNAIEYTLPGGKIACQARIKEKRIVIGIQDTGIGIPQNQQNQIFQKLFRADNTQKEHPKGIGLGLYITKAMVEAISGKIWFQSKEGEGTTFWVSLPLVGPKIRSGQKINEK